MKGGGRGSALTNVLGRRTSYLLSSKDVEPRNGGCEQINEDSGVIV